MVARKGFSKPDRILRRWALVCTLTIFGCQSASTNSAGTVDPGIGSPGASEVGQSAVQHVGSGGGSVGTPSQTAFASVPAGALSGSVNLSVQVDSPQGMPLQGNLLTNVYDFGPDDTRFAKPVILTVAVVNTPAAGQQAMLAWLDANQTWQALLDSAYNPSTSQVTATTTHFTAFGVVSYGTDGTGCAMQNDPNAFCGLLRLICNMRDNVCSQPAFTIGGTVTGLTGSLSLSDNLGEIVVVNGDGNFTFTETYDAGSSFVVSIASSSPDQNCTFVAGTAGGTVIDGPVTNITVVCQTNMPATFPIGGLVSGLDAGDSVTLTQGDQSVTVAANGDFVFPTELALQSNYTVAVSRSPAGKVCVVASNAAGTVTGYSLDIEVVCDPAAAPGQVGGVVTGLASGAMLVLLNLADPADVVAVSGNGNFIVSTDILVGADYNIVVSLQPEGQFCRVTNGAGVAEAGTWWGVSVVCQASVVVTTGQLAAMVIGEPDFTSSNTAGVVSSSLTFAPRGSAWGSADGPLFVPDTGAHRALVYPQFPDHDGAAAAGVLGQTGPDSGGAVTPATAASGQFAGIGGDANLLLLADPASNRVLVFAGGLPTGNTAADYVIGQPALAQNTNPAGCGARALGAPMGVATAEGRVVIADTANHRVLLYAGVPDGDGAAADGVLGQSDFNICTPPGAPSAATLDGPQGVWTDGTRVLVADTNAHRVLAWLSFPGVPAQPADAVIGQTGFASNAVVQGSTGTMLPSGVASDGNLVWTSSSGFHRVEQWLFPVAAQAGAAATAVLGHSNFTDTSVNACNCSIPNSLGLNAPGGVAVVGSTLVVTDTGNNRYIIFAGE